MPSNQFKLVVLAFAGIAMPTFAMGDLDQALLNAAQFDNANAITTLLGRGADPNGTNEYEWTPLHIATYLGNANAITALLQGGANPNCTSDRGETPLHFAVYQGNANTITALLQGGANVHYAADQREQIPPHIARPLHAAAGITKLAQAGTNPNYTNQRGQTPLYHTANLIHQHYLTQTILRKLLETGADMLPEGGEPFVIPFWGPRQPRDPFQLARRREIR